MTACGEIPQFAKSLFGRMTMEADDQAFMALLAPWWPVFPDNGLVIEPGGEDATGRVRTALLCVKLCDAGDGAVATWRRQCEAISVLLLGAEINPRAFLRAARAHCRHSIRIFVDIGSVEYEFSILLTSTYLWSVLSTWPFEAFTRLFSPKENYSEACEATRAELLRLVECPEKRRVCESKMFPVLIYLESSHCDKFVASLLRHIVRLHWVRPVRTPVVNHSIRRFFARSVELIPDIYSDELLQTTKLLASTPGLWLRSVLIDLNEREQTCGAYQRFLRTITGSGLENDAAHSKGADEIYVKDYEFDDERFVQLMTSLASSTSVHSVRLVTGWNRDRDRYDPSLRWMWLINSLFNETSCHSVTGITINDMFIRPSDIDAIRGTTRASRASNADEPTRLTKRITTHPIKRLALSLTRPTESSKRGMKALLEFVGWPLTHLSVCLEPYGLVHRDMRIIDESDLQEFWEYCPNLVTLRVDKLSIGSFGPILDAYAARKCRASSLGLRRCEVRDRASVFAFIEALQDADLVITRTLRQLDLHLGRDLTLDIPDDVLVALLTMLEVNRHLQTLIVLVTREQQVRFGPRFLALDGPTYRPLQMPAKCAFLSAVQGSESKETRPQAITQLDSMILSQIFALAGETFLRTIVLTGYLYG